MRTLQTVLFKQALKLSLNHVPFSYYGTWLRTLHRYLISGFIWWLDYTNTNSFVFGSVYFVWHIMLNHAKPVRSKEMML